MNKTFVVSVICVFLLNIDITSHGQVKGDSQESIFEKHLNEYLSIRKGKNTNRLLGMPKAVDDETSINIQKHFFALFSNEDFNINLYFSALGKCPDKDYIQQASENAIKYYSQNKMDAKLSYVISCTSLRNIGVHTSLESYLLMQYSNDIGRVLLVIFNSVDLSDSEAARSNIYEMLQRMFYGRIKNTENDLVKYMTKCKLWYFANLSKYKINSKYFLNDEPTDTNGYQEMFIASDSSN